MASQNKRPTTLPARFVTEDVGNTYRHYYETEAPSDPPEPSPQTLIRRHEAHRRLLKFSIKALDTAVTLATVVEEKLERAQAQRKTKLPKSIKLQIEKIYRNLIGAMGHLQDITLPEIVPILEAIQAHRKKIEPLMAKGTYVEMFGERVDLGWYKETIESVSIACVCWIKQLSVYRKKIKRGIHVLKERPSEAKKNTTGLFEAVEEPSSKPINQFLEGAKVRGWKVNAKPEDKSNAVATSPGFNASIDTLNNIQTSAVSLLPSHVPVGIVRFPIIIVQGTSRFTDSVIRELVASQLEYDIHKVFGDYIVIAQAMLMGIHKKLMHVYDAKIDPKTKQAQVVFTPLSSGSVITTTSKKPVQRKAKGVKVKLDWAKFRALMPYLKKEFPEFESQLERVGPVNPIISYSSHYYSPLFPTSLSYETNFSVGQWSPLTDKNSQQPSI